MESAPLLELIDQLKHSNFQEQLLFVEFQYGELKDMMTSFLTLITATFVLSLTFSEKIIDFESASKRQKKLLHSSLLVSLNYLCMILWLWTVLQLFGGGKCYSRNGFLITKNIF